MNIAGLFLNFTTVKMKGPTMFCDKGRSIEDGTENT